jgi:hypothetical protein
MASIPPSYYHASAAIPTTNHSDFFNTHISITLNDLHRQFLKTCNRYIPAFVPIWNPLRSPSSLLVPPVD